jgi:hypothetical protein
LHYYPFICFLGGHNRRLTKVKGIVLCSTTGKPIEYANIGIKNKPIGTISNINGSFEFNIQECVSSDLLVISCIGYESFSTTIENYSKRKAKDTILLQQKSYVLNEVVVLHSKFKTRFYGNKSKSKSVKAGFDKNELGYEIGVKINPKNSLLIQTIHLNIVKCTYDSVFYRVNIYNKSTNGEFQLVLEEPIYINLSTSRLKDNLVLDISEYNIQLKGESLITLQHIKNLGEGVL